MIGRQGKLNIFMQVINISPEFHENSTSSASHIEQKQLQVAIEMFPFFLLQSLFVCHGEPCSESS